MNRSAQQPATGHATDTPVGAYELAAVALAAAAVITYEIVLMQRLLLERWHHFAYLVISLALLGFGASGTLLALIEKGLHRHRFWLLPGIAATLCAAVLFIPHLAVHLPLTVCMLPADFYRRLAAWCAYFALCGLPFLLGGTFLGAALIGAGKRTASVYAANLLGSAVGAATAILATARLAPTDAFAPPLLLSLAAATLLLLERRTSGRGAFVPSSAAWRCLLVGVAVLAGAGTAVWPVPVRYDQFKAGARLEQLVRQGDARRVAALADPHGYVELYESPLFHELPLVAPAVRPPPMYCLAVNGEAVASILRIERPQQAEVMDTSLAAFPYRLLPASPRVLLLGELGGANAWLACRQNASQIDIVQPNAAVERILRKFAPALLEQPAVQLRLADPRPFVEQCPQGQYDLIQIVSLEGLGFATPGIRGLSEDHLATVEGLAACLKALSPHGLLAVSRGVEQPPRENIRLLATLAESLETLGLCEPGAHIVQVRDYLGVCTLAARKPLDADRLSRLREAIRELNLTPVWYAGLAPEEVNRPDTLPGPAGTRADWLHYAAGEIFSPRRQEFFQSWLFDVRPARDDRPFFWDFYKPQAIAELRRAYGQLWLTRAELGRLFLYVSLLGAAVAATGFILLPVGIHSVWQRFPGRAQNAPPPDASSLKATLGYFAAIGVGFMTVEMTLISRATHYLGDPVVASAAVIGGMLTASGLGSLLSTRIIGNRLRVAPATIALLVLVLSRLAWVRAEAGLATGLLLLTALLAAFAMGMPLPAGIRALQQLSPQLLPWAWGINGFASVLATGLALLIALTSGYRAVLMLAAACYAAAAALGPLLKTRAGRELRAGRGE